ncbi:MAG: xanthine dehydrogenase family protein molybdopterin-binding subunit [Acidobacteriota bacterium]
MSTTYKVIGTRPVRHDGADKVTGRALYGADLHLARMAHGAVLRSPHAHARIRGIRTERAKAMPGVYAVVTAGDFPAAPADKMVDFGEGEMLLSSLRGNVLAADKVLYAGHAVAAVAAASPHIAAEALELIEVDYEPLPAVFTTQEAMAPGAPVLHAGLRDGNVADYIRHELGDVAAGFAAADVIVEREWNTATVHQGYIEPQNATAFWSSDGRIHIWCSTQGSFIARDATAAVLDLPVSRLKVTPMEIGGGFGGKINVYLEPVAALLSRQAGRPVKLVMNRREVFTGTGPTPGSHVRVKIGATREGRITAAQAWLAYEAGAWPGAMVGPGAMTVFACYDIGNVLIDGFDVVVNKPSTAAYRAPGAPNAALATETALDDLARQLEMDPIELRLRNAARPGTRRADGPRYKSIGCVEVLEAMRQSPHYQAPLPGENCGRGVAIGFWFNAGLASSATIAVNHDGTVNLIEGSTDIGGSRAALAMQAAEVLGLRAEQVNPTVVDTDSIGYTGVTGGSRTTFSTGYAVHDAAQAVLSLLKQRAGRILGEETVSYEDGVFSAGGKTLSFAALAAQLESTGGPITASAAVNPRGVGGSVAGLIVDVRVDPETGKTDIVRVTSVQDAGRAIHPSYVEGQMQGGTAQGIGWALNEEYFFDSRGEMRNASYLDYRMPTALDLPMIETVIVEVPNPGHPFGVRGVGEANIVPPLPAVANAIRAATGRALHRVPMNPGSILGF